MTIDLIGNAFLLDFLSVWFWDPARTSYINNYYKYIS